MSSWLTREAPELQALAERLTRAAPLSLKRLMEWAGMSPQSLNYWRSGRSTPQPQSIERVGTTLVLHGERLQALGRELLAVVEEENRRQTAVNGRPPSEGLPLFEPGSE